MKKIMGKLEKDYSMRDVTNEFRVAESITGQLWKKFCKK